jgi:H+/Cl- antiporter ClcA
LKHLRHQTYGQASIWIGAAIVGISAVLYARLIALAQELYFSVFHAHSILTSLSTPLFFVGATALVGKIAPQAKGSGIPQVLEAISLAEVPETSEQAWHTDLVSLKTAGVKILSSLVGILGGASIGREGPTVQIASSGFAFVAKVTRRWVPRLDIRSYLTAGAAAGVAAAFNTPLAGITFALEEIAEESFGHFRQTVMLAVIIAGVTAQALLGDYLYFGHPAVLKPDLGLFPEAVLLGAIAGIFGGAFARLLSFPQLTRLPRKWWPRALVCGVLCGIIGYFTNGDTAGSG